MTYPSLSFISEILPLLPSDSAVIDYLSAFLANENESTPFLTYYDILPNKSLSIKTFSRREFWELIMMAISVLTNQNIQAQDRQIHFFSGNTVEDLAFRTASLFLKSVPVTVNWYCCELSSITRCNNIRLLTYIS